MLHKFYFIKTFGCQMNVSDSERIASFLESQNFKPTSKIAEADLVVFNTCGVRKMAEDRAYGQVHNLHKNNPKIKIAITGCLADRKDIQKKLEKKVDLFFPISDFNKLEKFIFENYSHSQKMNLKLSKEEIDYLSVTPKYSNSHSAFVPIMTGCDNFCSYCVVPYARGREVSRAPKEILEEIKKLVESGYKEITLLGQNVNSYSYSLSSSAPTGDPNNRINFPKLLQAIEKIPGYFWLRFVSSHPKDFSDELIETVAKSKKLCEYIHLPIQSGSDEILAKMNRKYTAKHYLGLVEKIKTAFEKHKPAILYALTTDIIVGFPGESKKDFLETAKIMRKAKYDLAFFGQYSPRPLTVSWKMKDDVSKSEKVEREKYLNDILAKTIYAKNKKYVGRVEEILIDSEKAGVLFGRTRTMKNVKVISENKKVEVKKFIGQFVQVKITKANVWNLEGIIQKMQI